MSVSALVVAVWFVAGDHDDPDLGWYRRGEAARGGPRCGRRRCDLLARWTVGTLNLPPGRVRVGGFGGAGGLADYLRRSTLPPWWTRRTPSLRNHQERGAGGEPTGTPLVRLERPGWAGTRTPIVDLGADAAAARAAAESACRPFLTTGRQSLQDFLPGPIGTCWSGWSIRRLPHCRNAGTSYCPAGRTATTSTRF